MTVREARMVLERITEAYGDDLEITVRCSWEEMEPNGNCFSLNGIMLDHEHGEGTPFVAFDCDQDFEAEEVSEDGPGLPRRR